MTQPTRIGRRAFAAFAAGAAAAAAATSAPTWAGLPAGEARDTFVRDLARCYERQLVGFDMADVDAIFKGLGAGRLGIGQRGGPQPHHGALRAALDSAGPVGRHTLVLITHPPREVRLRHYKEAFNAVRDEAPPDATIIYGAGDDPALPPGMVRVALLTG